MLKKMIRFTILTFLAFPLCSPVSGEEGGLHIGAMMQPVSRDSVLEEAGYFVWGASMTQTGDGVCHLFYCRWPEPFKSWITDAEIVHATAETPAGPYTPREVVLGKRDAEYWDGVSVYNPQVLEADGRYYLYYTGNNGDIRLRRDDAGNPVTQRIGVAVADHPEGPWKRPDAPLIDISKEGPDSGFCCNPAVARTPQGAFLMVYKCGAGTGRQGRVVHTTALSESPAGSFRKSGLIVFDDPSSRFPAEDPFVWYQKDRFYAVLKDMRGSFSPAGESLIQFESRDGKQWRPSSPVLVSPREIHWQDGETEKVDRLERPQIWLKEGKPAMLFCAVKKGDHSYNVHIPLGETEEKEN